MDQVNPIMAVCFNKTFVLVSRCFLFVLLEVSGGEEPGLFKHLFKLVVHYTYQHRPCPVVDCTHEGQLQPPSRTW